MFKENCFPVYKNLCDYCKPGNITDHHSPEKCLLLENVDNRKEILRNKVLVTSLPVNTTQVIFHRTNKINFQKERKWLSQLVQTSSTLVRLNSSHSIFEHIPSAKVSKRR